MKRLVLMGEGDGDVAALPVLADRLLGEMNGRDCLFIDPHPLKVGGLGKLIKNNFSNWCRYLTVAARRRSVGAVLVVLDGDLRHCPIQRTGLFCAKNVAKAMAEKAKTAIDAGNTISVAIVIARQEYESWLIAGIESLAGRMLSDGRRGVRENAMPPDQSLEENLRDAKSWLKHHMHDGYRETRDQPELTRLVDLSLIRERGDLRSFKRLESAVDQLIEGNRNNSHICTPT